MRTPRRLLACLAAGALLAWSEPSQAGRTEQVVITFRPTTALAAAELQTWRPIRTVPVNLLVEDGLTDENRALIGQRKWPVGRPYKLQPTSDLKAVLGPGLVKHASTWGLLIEPDAPSTLRITLTSANVYERVRFFGMSSYYGDASLSLSLVDARGTELWTGETSKETYRFGRDESDENTSEVISDAVVQGLAELLGDPHLQAAWVDSAVKPVDEPAPAQRPEAVLAQLIELMEAGYSEDTLVQLAAGIRLERPLNTEDLLAWKQAGIPERVVQKLLGPSEAEPQ